MLDIKSYETSQKVEPIQKGWSNDKKFYIETVTNEKLLLRIADISAFKELFVPITIQGVLIIRTIFPIL